MIVIGPLHAGIQNSIRAPAKVHIFISKMPIPSPNPTFYTLLESSHRDTSNKLSNIGYGEEITQVELIKVHFQCLIWSSVAESSMFQNTMQGVQSDFTLF